MTHAKLEEMIAIMSSNGIKYNSRFETILEHGFSDEVKESFFEKVMEDLDAVLRSGESTEFNKIIKKAALDLTNIAVKCGEEGRRAVGIDKLRQEKKLCMAGVKLTKPQVTPKPAQTAAKPAGGSAQATSAEHRCTQCGALLNMLDDGRFKCKYCGCTYDNIKAAEDTEKMYKMFDSAKREMINNLRRNLYDTVNAEIISSVDVKNACIELKKYLPDDFRACFYEIAVGNSMKDITSAIRKIDTVKYYGEVESIVKFLIKSLELDFLLELNDLVERAYKQRDLALYGKYASAISEQADKLQKGVYETRLPREVFVAYSGKDMQYVKDLVEFLEAQGLNCFVAARNLRHGRGSAEDYEKSIKDAIDHCKCFVFVSTLNSRAFGCDALKIEIPYVQKRDMENSPPEYRNNYEAIPHIYKKPRVEYRVESSKGFNVADNITNEFFHGYEWVLSPEDVADRVMKQLVKAT